MSKKDFVLQQVAKGIESPAEIAELWKGDGELTPAYVSSIKSKYGDEAPTTTTKKKSVKNPPKKKAESKSTPATKAEADTLMMAVDFVESVGGLEKAGELIQQLAEIKARI